MIDWKDIARFEMRRYQDIYSTDPQRFVYWALRLWGVPYELGKENLFSSDCSGTICFPLLMMGYNIRVTAHELYKDVFTRHCTSEYNPQAIRAMFYRRTSDNRVTHVAPLVGKDILLQAGPKDVHLALASRIDQWFVTQRHQPIVRELDPGELNKIALRGGRAWGVDKEVKEILDVE